MSRKTKIEALREQHEAARLQFQTARLQKATAIMASYDATETNKQRRQPQRENQDEGEIYNITKRLLGCNLGRDLERNYSPAKSMLHQMRVNVVGSKGKIKVNTKGGEEATAWFNQVWAKDCDFRDDLDFTTVLGNVLTSELREGDLLAVVDDDLVEDTGKILTWESDQILPVSDAILEKSAYKTAVQDHGILRHKNGKILGYSCTGRRGIGIIDRDEDATFWARGLARLCKNPWRLNQGRGIPALLTSANNFVDLYEILASELQSAKRAAKQYAYVKRTNAVTDWDSPATGPEFLPENDGRTSAEVALDGANQTTHTAKNYESLEGFTGGLTDYLDAEDAVEFPKLDHPNSALAPFLEAVHGYSGSALGLARAYTILRADSSYTAFRGDMIMSWVTFYWLQKHMERTADWIASRVLLWAQRRKQIKPLPTGWERSLSWTWPTMPAVDELKESTAEAQALKNGTRDFSDILGPDWEKRFESLAAQLKKAKELDLPLSVFEQKSGGVVPSKADSETVAEDEKQIKE